MFVSVKKKNAQATANKFSTPDDQYGTQRFSTLLRSASVMFALIMTGGLYAGTANAQPTGERLPVNTFTQLPKSGTRDLQRSARAL